MSLKDALTADKELYPGWLENSSWLESIKSQNNPAGSAAAFTDALNGAPGCKKVFLKADSKTTALPDFPAREMMKGRVVFYPGAGADGQPLRLFSGAHAAHCFIYADYGVKRGEVTRQFGGDLAGLLPGYKSLFVIEGGVKDFFPLGWEDLRETYTDIDEFFPPELQWGLWAVLEREPQYDAAHGPKRLLFCYLCCDAVSAFTSLWPRGKRRTFPYGIVIEDSGFGSNWAVFGSERSQLYKIAARNHALPNWLLVAVGRSSQAWPGYGRFSEEEEPGGADKAARALYIKKEI